MLLGGVGARFMTGGQPVVDVPPMVGRDILRIDADRLDGVDMAEHLFDPGPAVDLQQDLAAGPHEGQRLIGLVRLHGAHDVDARDDRAEVVRRPADEGEDRARPEREDAPPPVDDGFRRQPTEANPVLDLLLDMDQFDMRQAGRREALTARGRRARGEPRCRS